MRKKTQLNAAMLHLHELSTSRRRTGWRQMNVFIRNGDFKYIIYLYQLNHFFEMSVE